MPTNKQLALDLGMEPEWNGLFWSHCVHVNPGVSLTWQPPDYKIGQCVFCGREFAFKTREGKERDDTM